MVLITCTFSHRIYDKLVKISGERSVWYLTSGSKDIPKSFEDFLCKKVQSICSQTYALSKRVFTELFSIFINISKFKREPSKV